MTPKLFVILTLGILLLVTPLSFAPMPNYYSCNPMCSPPAYFDCYYCSGPCWACWDVMEGYFFGYGGGGYDVDDDDGPSPKKIMSMELDISCDENVVTVTYKDSPLSGARVAVIDVTDGPIFSGDTDSNGQIKFQGCDMKVNIFVSKSGYKKVSVTRDLIDCEQCVPPECTSDTDCPDNEYCVEEECVPVPCPCGQVINHACVGYECCADADCPANQVCVNNACKPPYECTSDANCPDTHYCDIPAGAAGGNCAAVTGCGDVINHALVPYECGDAPGCPSCPATHTCVNNICVENDLTGPESGFLGDDATVTATVGDESCSNCDVEVTDPTGRKLTGKTDENGNLVIPLNLQGTYQVALLKNGTPIKSIAINALSKPAVEEPERPAAVAEDNLSLLFLLVLLALILAGLVYWRSRQGK